MEQNLLQAWALERVCDALLSLEVASSLVKHVMPIAGLDRLSVALASFGQAFKKKNGM